MKAVGHMKAESILWRRLDSPGHEFCRLFLQDSNWHLAGTAVFSHSQRPCCLDYMVICNSDWITLSGRVAGFVGDETVQIELSVDSARRWRLNGLECPKVAGCIDLDLAFSPSTNMLPIRRLNLAIGQESKVSAAWLRFPSFTLEPLDQIYRRIDAAAYHYESAGSTFATELQVNEAGFITLYPDLWQVETSALSTKVDPILNLQSKVDLWAFACIEFEINSNRSGTSI
jgi:hypothetical protein